MLFVVAQFEQALELVTYLIMVPTYLLVSCYTLSPPPPRTSVYTNYTLVCTNQKFRPLHIRSKLCRVCINWTCRLLHIVSQSNLSPFHLTYSNTVYFRVYFSHSKFLIATVYSTSCFIILLNVMFHTTRAVYPMSLHVSESTSHAHSTVYHST